LRLREKVGQDEAVPEIVDADCAYEVRGEAMKRITLRVKKVFLKN